MSESLLKILAKRPDDFAVKDFISWLGTDGEVSDDEGETYYEFHQRGVSLLFGTDGTLSAIFLYGRNNEGFEAYEGLLPLGLTFSLSRDEVRQVLGEPSKTGEGRSILNAGEIHPWERYDLPEAIVHARYTENENEITLVTLMTPAAAP